MSLYPIMAAIIVFLSMTIVDYIIKIAGLSPPKWVTLLIYAIINYVIYLVVLHFARAVCI